MSAGCVSGIGYLESFGYVALGTYRSESIGGISVMDIKFSSVPQTFA